MNTRTRKPTPISTLSTDHVVSDYARSPVDASLSAPVTSASSRGPRTGPRTQRSAPGPSNAPRTDRIDPLATLFPYQRAGAAFLRSREVCLFSDEMGLGKSVQALAALDTKNPRALIVCPASLRLNWAAEVRQWLPGARLRIEQPKKGQIPRLRPEAGEIVIVAYGSLPKPLEQDRLVREDLSAVTLIADEIHYAKEWSALRTKAAHALVCQVGRAWGLTGTPLLGRPLDLYGVVRTMNLLPLTFKSFERFVAMLGGVQNHWGGWEFGEKKSRSAKRECTPAQLAAANACLAPVMLRRKRADVLPELPKKTYATVTVPIAGSRTFGEAERAWQLYGAEELPPFEMLSAAMAELARAKIPGLIEEVARFEEEEIPLLVFSAHAEPVLALAKREGWAVIHGGVSMAARHAIVKKFQAGELRGLALTIGAGGTGLTLTYASHLLFVDRAYTPAENEQAEDRAARIGQTASSIQVRDLVADHPLDRHLHDVLAVKRRLIRGIVG